MLTVGLALCSCGVGGIVSPEDGATHVPTDAEIVAVSADDIESVALTPEVEFEETKRGPFGLYRWVTFKPAEPLLADADYTVEVTTDGNGVWTLGFTTSSGPGSDAPPAPAVRSLKAAHIPPGGVGGRGFNWRVGAPASRAGMGGNGHRIHEMSARTGWSPRIIL